LYLKSLKLVGFKSFADRTQIELRPGVTVVVGPNGSGKSNLVDALSWVMGTQSPKALRTGKMEDVVFAGTATRPSLNRAEVTLVVDNEGRRIPLDLDEVSMTRRLYRDGSSDYEINGVPCRLLDIEELLSDSGVGRHQHVIIGQGEIGMVLNASPEEHRAVIEEAAGILKHRRRKEKAERRLERTDEDLVRLQDLVGEIERQMRPLKRQARAAERYQDLKGQVRALVLYLAGSKLESYESETLTITAERADLAADTGAAEDSLRVSGSDLERLTAEATIIGSDLDRDTSAGARLETTAERIRRMGSVAHERIRTATGRAQAADERRADLEDELGSIRSELDQVTDEEARLAGLSEALEAAFRSLEDEEHSIATQTTLSPEGAAAAVRGELSALVAASNRDQRESVAITGRLDVIDAQLQDETEEIERINGEIRVVDERQSELAVVYSTASSVRARDQEQWSGAEETMLAARMEQAACSARLEAVTSAIDGVFDLDARRTIESAAGAIGTLLAALDVPEGLERAVEAALGPWMASVAFAGDGSLVGAVESIKSSGGGGVPVVTGQSGAPGESAANAAREGGVTTLGAGLGAAADQTLAELLLGDVLLVEGWNAAWHLVRRHPNLRAVTPEGDLITSFGILVAHPDGAGPAMLESAEVSLERAGTELARATSLLTAAKRDFEKSREAERAALEELERVEASLAGKTEAMARLQQSVDSLGGEKTRLVERRDSLALSIEQRGAQAVELEQRLAALEGEEASRLRAWEELEGRRLALAAEREEARSEWQAAATRLQSVYERRKLLTERSERIESELSSGGRQQNEAVDIDALALIERVAGRANLIIAGKLTSLRERQSDLRTRNETAQADLRSARLTHDSAREQIASNRERLASIDVRLTELRLHTESVIETIRRDADAGVDEAHSAQRPDLAEAINLEEELSEKSAQLKRLGPINPLAAEEYRDMSERHSFLTGQLADIESSRAELRKVIAALDAEIEQRFKAAFDEVAEAYGRYFSILFPGGRGRIRLTEPGDRHSGLTIEAQPVGKKVSQMSLLSGGERSLAALAFLFAIFEARPSPFYVLDEVEAALDDANLRRFLRIVDEFRQKAQVVIITHQQQTMEIADVLYGVTMEPGGSSQAVRKDMSAARAGRVA
jgi:chromosome segregation protein